MNSKHKITHLVHISKKKHQQTTNKNSTNFHEGEDNNKKEEDEYIYYTSTSIDVVPRDVVNVAIPPSSNITKIEDQAFSDCDVLNSISIPSSVNYIGHYAFHHCKSLVFISIPNSVINIDYTFHYCTSLTDVIIPNSVTSIKAAFKHCTSLHSVLIPNSVTNMHRSFEGCKSLVSISVPSSVTTMTATFLNCTSLRSVSISKKSSIRDISHTFAGCTSLISINIPNSIDDMTCAFQDCASLASISIPLSPQSLEMEKWDTFGLCKSLDQRKSNGMNYHNDIYEWLYHRFDNLPIHQACHDIELTPTALLTAMNSEKNKGTLSFVDAMDMTPLHILCCNPNVTAEMIEILGAANPYAVGERDVLGMTPLKMFLACKGVQEEHDQLEDMYAIFKLKLTSDEMMCIFELLTIIGTLTGPNIKELCALELENTTELFSKLLELGVSGEGLQCALTLMRENSYYLELGKTNKGGLHPFMLAASLSQCGLDSLYMLAMKRPDLLI